MNFAIGPRYHSMYPAGGRVGGIRPADDPYGDYERQIEALEAALPGKKNRKTDEHGGHGNHQDCHTCENRRYQDVSNDAGVSFKSPTKLSPEVAASAVRSHENEHVAIRKAEANERGGKIVSQSVSIFTSVCSECKTVYVSGGETRTSTRYGSDGKEIPDADNKRGKKLDAVA